MSFLFQVLTTCNLLGVAAMITVVGVVLIIADSISQILTSPDLVTDAENPSGVTVNNPLHNVFTTSVLH